MERAGRNTLGRRAFVAALASLLCAAQASITAAIPITGDWPGDGAPSAAALCRWFRTHSSVSPVPPTCRVLCEVSRGDVRAAVLQRGTGFHEGLAVAIRERRPFRARPAFRIVHDDVDDEDGIVVQGGAFGRLTVRACKLEGDTHTPTLTFDVVRMQTADPPNACDVTRDTTRLTCANAETEYTCSRTVVDPKVTTRDPTLACSP